MKRSFIETLLGAVVLLIAGMFIVFAYNSSTTRQSSGGGSQQLKASFTKVDGINIGTDVKISGIKVGRVSDLSLDKQSFLATVTIDIDRGLSLPKDSVITIASEGLLGGNYVGITPGGDEETLKNGDSFSFAQSPTSLTDMLSRFVFSAAQGKDSKNGDEKDKAN
jgi:phospholipid/cholesterol/gamma-HCH transport system substrate-binding protein